MRYWDSSAIISVILEEPKSPEMRILLSEDRSILSVWSSSVECYSALCRRFREKFFKEKEFSEIELKLFRFFDNIKLIFPNKELQTVAQKLLKSYPLRAADAIQLASALLWKKQKPEFMDFICLDKQLSAAAQKEGFRIFPEGYMPIKS